MIGTTPVPRPFLTPISPPSSLRDFAVDPAVLPTFAVNPHPFSHAIDASEFTNPRSELGKPEVGASRPLRARCTPMSNQSFCRWPLLQFLTLLALFLPLRQNPLLAGVDPTFHCVVGGESGEVFAMARQPDGRIVIGGNFTSVKGEVRYGVARLNPDGTIDPTFDAGLLLPAQVAAVAIEADGRILVGGSFQSLNGKPAYALLRLQANGSPDPSFTALTNIINASSVPRPSNVTSLRTLPDGGFLVGGGFERVGSEYHRRIARFRPDGTLDSSFNAQVNYGNVLAIALQADGRILIGGGFSQVNTTNRMNLARLLGNGLLDTTFDPANFAYGTCDSILLDSTGRIVISGVGYVRRLSPDGRTLDPTFIEPELGQNSEAYTVASNPDGGYTVGGEFYSMGNRFSLSGVTLASNTWVAVGNAVCTYTDYYPSRADLVNLKPTGPTTGSMWRSVAYGNKVLVAVDGGLQVSVSKDATNWISHGAATDSGLNAVSFVDDRFIAVGAKGTIRISTDAGDTWSTPSQPPAASADLMAVAVQSGTWVAVGGTPDSGSVAISPDGSTWTLSSITTNLLRGVAFGGNTWVAVGNGGTILTSPDARVWTPATNATPETLNAVAYGNGYFLAVGESGRILTSTNGRSWTKASNYSMQLPLAPLRAVAFGVTKFIIVGGNGTVFAVDPGYPPPGIYPVVSFLTQRDTTALLRLDPNGIIQTNFTTTVRNNVSNYKENVRAILPDDRGAIVAGQFVHIQTSAALYDPRYLDSGDLARVTWSGLLDLTMNIGMGVGGESPPQTLLLQPDGKLLLGGDFTSVNGISRNRIARVLPNGAVDAGFDPGTGADRAIYSIALAPDGKILVGGFFNSVGNASSRPLARLRPDGSADTSFILPPFNPVFNDTITTIAVQSDGRVVVNGSTQKIARFLTNGVPDTDFQIGTGFKSGGVSSIVVGPENTLVVAGSFTNFNGRTANGIARLLPTGKVDEAFMLNLGSGADQAVRMVLRPPQDLASGSVLLAGSFSQVNGINLNRRALVSAAGTLDATFGTGSAFPTNLNLISATGLPPDGKALTNILFVAGPFTSVDGQPRNFLAALNPDGSVRPTFNTGSGPDGSIFAIAAQPDGNLIVGGSFRSIDGTRQLSLVRMKEDGATTPPTATALNQWKNQTFTTAELADASVSGDLADPDHDGIPNWAEFALNLDPKSPVTKPQPVSSVQPNPADGKAYLIYAYRRRTGDSGVDYTIEFSQDLISWQASTARVEEVGRQPDPGGTTETVLVRIKPSIQEAPSAYLRCRMNPR